jgi:hypothetical protein
LSWFIRRGFRIYDLNLEPTALAKEATPMLLEGLLDPTVVVSQIELGPVGVAFEELSFGVLLYPALGITNGVNQLLTHFVGYLVRVVINLLILKQCLPCRAERSCEAAGGIRLLRCHDIALASNGLAALVRPTFNNSRLDVWVTLVEVVLDQAAQLSRISELEGPPTFEWWS